LLLAVPLAASAITITPALVEGDAVAGVGVVTRIDNLAVNNDGAWLVEADTDHANTDADQVLVRDGVLYLREMDPLAEPAGANLDSFDSINLNNNLDSGWNFFLDGTAGSNDDSGIYFNTTLVIQEGDISTSPDFSPGTPYIGFFDAKIDNNNSNQIFMVASIDDPAIPTSVDRALVVLDIDASGNLLAENVIAKEGDILSGQVDAVSDFGTGPHQSSFNDFGDVLFFADLDGASTTDGVVYLNDMLLAQEGSASPVGGRNYEFLSSRGMNLSNARYVFKANLDGDTSDDDLIIRDGAVFRREGDSLPAIGAFTFTSFGTGSGPVQVDNAGNVLWYGDWNDPDTDIDTGLFLNDQLIVQEGVTMIGGLLVDTISSGSDAFQMSKNGAWVIFEATLEGGINGAFLIDLQVPIPVLLSGFTAEPEGRAVRVSWFTSFEYLHDGFNVYRSRLLGSGYAKLNDALIRGPSPYSYFDRAVQSSTTYFYKLGAVDSRGHEGRYSPTSVTTPAWGVRTTLSLARPSPFRKETLINFTLAEPAEAKLAVHDVAGRLVRTLVRETLPGGDHAVNWDGRDDAGLRVGGGTYFVKLTAGETTETRKVVFLGGR
jgi:hypothetical protein